MARTLIITNSDFSVNKLDTVVFSDKPCTAIALNNSTMSITSIGNTGTLIATTIPADTTDAVIWTSSNSDVATVVGGVVTASGCGTVDITATCGTYSASCSVTVTHIAVFDYALNRYAGKSDNKIRLDGGDLANYAIGFSSVGSTLRVTYADRQLDRYPLIIPNGATTMTIACTNFKPYGYWLDSKTASDAATVAYACPQNEFGTSLQTPGTRTVTIPARSGDYATMDSVCLVFRYSGSGDISDATMEEITITFTA